MKVLMFGWEFPPHISGGLGTACHGLTNALGKEGVATLFVVPTLHGGETVANGTLINASEIIIRPADAGENIPTEDAPNFQLKAEPDTILKAGEKMIPPSNSLSEVIEQTFVKLEVPVALIPYQPVDASPVPEKKINVRHWNYALPHHYSIQDVYRESAGSSTTDALLSDSKLIPDESEGISYDFTGTYGETLMDEIEKYALVARTISTQYNFDVIHAHDWLTFRAGMEAQKLTGRPLVVHVHATEYDRAGKGGNARVREIEREGMMAADLVLAVSERTRQIAIKEYDIPETKIEVVHNGIMPSAKQKIKFSTPVASHIVSFLGRVTYQKGPLFFVEAARTVLEQFPEAHFLVAGSGDLLPKMIERVAQLRLSNNFHFTGFVKGDQIEKIWAMTDVYVMPSVSEPFGITPLEAIQAGVPVIISNQAGVSEVMPHAIKVDFWNTEAMAEAICSVLRYKGLSTTLKKNSIKAIKNISWEKAAKKIKTLYDELANQTRNSA